MILVSVLSMPATDYTWKGDVIAAPPGPVYCLYTVKQKVYTQKGGQPQGRGPGGCSCMGETCVTRGPVFHLRGHIAPKCSTLSLPPQTNY